MAVKNGRVQFITKLPTEVKALLKKKSAETKINQNTIVVEVLKKYLGVASEFKLP